MNIEVHIIPAGKCLTGIIDELLMKDNQLYRVHHLNGNFCETAMLVFRTLTEYI